ncbi:MAG: AAA family ATPase [Chloroflexi bacterium]|nr:AAA family ATPase [Chloroflexota bacterium]
MPARADDRQILLPNQLLLGALAAAKGNDWARARELCAQALASAPDHEDALLWQAVWADSWAAKFQALQRVLANNPKHETARVLLNWAQGRQSRGEPVRSAVEAECLTPCPKLGTRDDAGARFTYACPGNHCHAEATRRRPPRDVPTDTQQETCLSANHLACPTYCRVQAAARNAGYQPELRDYFDYFGLDEEPFSIVPIPRFYYPTRQHQEALETCRQVIRHRQGLALVYAHVGMGKSLLLRKLHEELFADTRYRVALLHHPNYASEFAFMEALLQALHETPARRRSLQDLEQALQAYLKQQVLEARKTVVLLIDEAHQMSPRCLAQLRRVLDYHVGEQQMVQVVLAGQLPLAHRLAANPALADRVVARCELRPLGLADAKEMISARLHEAGSANGLFTPAAVHAIVEATEGRPRQINLVCMKCLWEAFADRRHSIDADLVARVARGAGPAEEPAPAEDAKAESGVLSRLRLLWQRGGSN